MSTVLEEYLCPKSACKHAFLNQYGFHHCSRMRNIKEYGCKDFEGKGENEMDNNEETMMVQIPIDYVCVPRIRFENLVHNEAIIYSRTQCTHCENFVYYEHKYCGYCGKEHRHG